MAQSITLETYISLEKEFGKAIAEKVSKLIDFSFAQADKKVEDIATQKKLQIKDELSKELASKGDLAVLESKLLLEIELVNSKIEKVESKLDKKMTIYFLVLLSVMILLNKDSLTFIAQLIGLVK